MLFKWVIDNNSVTFLFFENIYKNFESLIIFENVVQSLCKNIFMDILFHCNLDLIVT